MDNRAFRRKWISAPIYRRAAKALPAMSETEQAALDAGDVWWDAELFTGNPDWAKLRSTLPPALTAEELAFLDGPVQQLCGMLDDWQIHHELGDLPPEVWRFMRERRFFGMIIPKDYGGLGFSAYAHSEVVRRISTRSATAAVTVMVPNSLGPGELLLQFGTEQQRRHWLPRLANGTEIPCFGLTSPEAGSDAAAMVDTGVVCRGNYLGREVVGMRLNWHKRYITLGPVATVLGLAFKLTDPEGILGGAAELGITVALVPTDTPGVEIGRRHLPAMQMFQNGPNRGRDVFLPLDAIIGGEERAGQGWPMLMSALAAGRGISLPSLSAAAGAFAAHTAGAYARVREQFKLPIGRFEGIQEKLGAMAATAYVLDAGRRLTCAGLDAGHKPAVISAILKLHATESMRAVVNDAMDIHGGKGIMDGPLNYLGNLYRSIPIGITVEGANILTRSLIVFGQGAIRCHPYLMRELEALADTDRERGLALFDEVFWRHCGHAVKTLGRAWGRAWTGGRYAHAPELPTRPYYRRLARYCAAFALAADAALLSLGGALKRREMLSARLGDIHAELYLLCAVLKRWEDEGQHEADLPLLELAMERGCARIEQSFDGLYANLPARPLAWLLRFVTLPLGPRRRGPRDALIQECAHILTVPSATRSRLTAGVFHPAGEEDGLGRLEHAFAAVVAAEPLQERIRQAGCRDWHHARDQGILTRGEIEQMQALEAAVAAVVQVDDFAAGAFARGASAQTG